MRRLSALLLLLALVPAAHAQPPSFDQAYQVRAAVGDIPTTEAVEQAGTWNVVQQLRVQYDNGSAQDFHFAFPTGATFVSAVCPTCDDMQTDAGADALVFRLNPGTASGEHTLVVTTRQAFEDAVAFTFVPPIEAGPDQAYILYVPAGATLDAPAQGSSPGASTDGSSRIEAFTFDADRPVPRPFWVAVHPTVAGQGDGETDDDDDGFLREWLLPLLAGALLGVLLWAFLVQRGLVQARSRRQVAQTAAHVEAAQAEPRAVLEAKKRALLAALKDLELGRQSNEIDVAAYDGAKADLKKQAVTVMRALEAAPKGD